MKRDLHTHTTYSDGKAGAEEMILAAIRAGLDEIGISDHSYTDFDESYCMKKSAIPAYLAEIAALKQKYAGVISVKCGVEQDLFSQESTAPFDYAIGSAHYILSGGAYYPLDKNKAEFVSLCETRFGGDYFALAEEYYDKLAAFADRKDISIIGHFDLITKYNEGNALFDQNHPRYLAAAKKCLDQLAAAGKIFEINTGAIARGYRTTPYPDEPLLAYIRKKGCPLLLSSDAHSPETVAFAFDRISL